ncbi:MAG: hypothetical protein OEV55_04800 [candidate division Zixibacteria bacterium]|nr:hypothetical protein [candidate division Zixibacteria bacterium]
MIKNLKLIAMVIAIILLSFSLVSPVDNENSFEDKSSKDKIPEARELPVPKIEPEPLQNYYIPWSTLNGGGHDMASTGYRVMVSAAQTAIGESQSTNYQMQTGYWYGGKPFVCGDANGTGDVSLSDIVYMIYNLFKYGPDPDPLYCADTNGDDNVTISDIVYLISNLFKAGPAPVC